MSNGCGFPEPQTALAVSRCLTRLVAGVVASCFTGCAIPTGRTSTFSTMPEPSGQPAGQIGERFPDYEPKLTPDTIVDYRPSLAPRRSQLPPAHLEALPELLNALRQFQALAAQHPGEWREGKLPFGGEPREYFPSDEELLAFEVGERIRAVVEATPRRQVGKVLKGAGVEALWVEYPAFTIYHADVMGSGRFFHVKNLTVVRLRLHE